MLVRALRGSAGRVRDGASRMQGRRECERESATAHNDYWGKIQIRWGRGISTNKAGRLDLQVGYGGRRGAVDWPGGGRRGREEVGAGDDGLGAGLEVGEPEGRVGGFDAVGGAAPCAGVGDVVDRAGVEPGADAVVGGFFSVGAGNERRRGRKVQVSMSVPR